MAMLNPRQILAFAPGQDVRLGSLADVVVSRIDLYPRKRTCAAHLAMSALGQKRTWVSVIPTALCLRRKLLEVIKVESGTRLNAGRPLTSQCNRDVPVAQ